MNVKFTDLVKHIAELDVATAQAYTMVEAATGIKIDSLTDYILKFIFRLFRVPISVPDLKN